LIVIVDVDDAVLEWRNRKSVIKIIMKEIWNGLSVLVQVQIGRSISPS